MAIHPRPPRSRHFAPPDESALPTLWTVSVTRLARLLSDVIPEFDARARIMPINRGFEEAARHIRQRLQSEPCDVIVAAGSNGAYLKGRVPVPVVLVTPTGFDLMNALARARKISDRIGVITHQTDLPEFAEFQRSFGLRIAQRTFITAEDARDSVAELVAKGVKVVVGTGLATELAEEAGLTGILLYSADTVRSAFESALDIARAARAAELPGRRAGRLSANGRGAPLAAGMDALLGESPEIAEIREQVRRYAPTDTTVLIAGDTGTGKELVARALHAESRRRKGPFVAVNCGALAESLLESELFGHEEGAFTGSRRGGRVGLIESADGGTLFLDEIGEMPLPLQTRLLRVLEEREVLRVGSSRPIPVDLRVIAATNRDLASFVRERQFRRDLYYRLDILRISLPRLAQHRGDIPLLAEHFLRQENPSSAATLAPDAIALLLNYGWPGNVRELRNLIERVCAHREADAHAALLTAEDFLRRAPELAAAAAPPHSHVAADDPPLSSAPHRSGMRPRSRPSQDDLRAILTRANGDRGLAASMLGVSRTTLWRWLGALDD